MTFRDFPFPMKRNEVVIGLNSSLLKIYFEKKGGGKLKRV